MTNNTITFKQASIIMNTIALTIIESIDASCDFEQMDIAVLTDTINEQTKIAFENICDILEIKQISLEE